MSKLRIGVFLNPESQYYPGGTYSYYQTLVKGMDQYPFSEEIDLFFILPYSGKKPEISLNKKVLYIKSWLLGAKKPLVFYSKPGKSSLFRWLLDNSAWKKAIMALVRNRAYYNFEKKLRTNRVDILYHLVPKMLPLNYPFMANHWDIGHLSTYSFPELVLNGTFQGREEYYNTFLKRAMLVLCESNSGARELEGYFPLFKSKIKVLPIFPSDLIKLEVDPSLSDSLLHSLGLNKEGFFVYPAQFWALKNHFNLIRAFELVLGTHPKLKLVFCGKDMGNLEYIEKEVAIRGLQDSILFSGFIDNESLVVLYKNAIALVMPTFLGPTNMPPLEAAMLGCPVICSNFEGHKEMLDNSAIYIEPENYESIAGGMLKVLDPNFDRERFIDEARNRMESSPFTLESSLIKLNQIFQELISIRKTWGL